LTISDRRRRHAVLGPVTADAHAGDWSCKGEALFVENLAEAR